MGAAKPVKAISVDDIKKIVPQFDISWLENNKNDARALLWRLGLDTDYSVEVQKGLTHRTMLCGISNCDRILSVERTDKEWLLSGYASEEAKLYTPDGSLTKELGKISKRVIN